eukprot:SAG31_NODE_4845_length_2908_cov_5.326095_6_plen_105_part_00
MYVPVLNLVRTTPHCTAVTQADSAARGGAEPADGGGPGCVSPAAAAAGHRGSSASAAAAAAAAAAPASCAASQPIGCGSRDRLLLLVIARCCPRQGEALDMPGA